TSGRRAGTRSQASSPSAASPTTAIPGWALTRAFSPSRTTAWSSARKTRNSPIATLPVPAREWDPGDDRRAPPGPGLDRQRTADQRRPLPHPEQAQPTPAGPGRGGRVGVEPPPVVLDHRGHLARRPLE